MKRKIAKKQENIAFKEKSLRPRQAEMESIPKYLRVGPDVNLFPKQEKVSFLLKCPENGTYQIFSGNMSCYDRKLELDLSL